MSILDNIDNEMDNKTLETTLKLIYTYTGITMQDYKKNMIQSRLRKRIKELNFLNYNSYIDYLQNNKNEVQYFINLITTNETFFFRTDKVWDYFNNNFLKNWYTENQNNTLKIWSAASSTGEEAYSIAICCEEFKELHPSFKYKIIGTDISSKAISIAKNAVYKEKSLTHLKKKHPLLINKYLIVENDLFRVIDKIKENVAFNQHNLFNFMPKNEIFNIVFFRNALIYFAAPEQEKVVSVIENSISDNGILILGESETLRNIQHNFQFKSQLIYEKTRVKI